MLQFKGAGEAQMRHQDIMRCIVKRWDVCQYKISSYSRQFRTRFLCFIAIVRFLFMDNLMPYLLWLHLWSSNKILEQVYFFCLLFYLDNLYYLLSICTNVRNNTGTNYSHFSFKYVSSLGTFHNLLLFPPLNLIII